ncbi:hypothetical protein R1sor_000571 [Riccia sorocarpa]|uniref:Uncharacterized protein n=1 Tax=Riccia sorocarpa TaxID=122646 RepID=A0ABD3GZH5_9MARC
MPPRPKYPSDSIDYHKRRRPEWAHSVRIPEDKQSQFYELKATLGNNMDDTFRFVLDSAEAAIDQVLEGRSSRVIPDSSREGSWLDCRSHGHVGKQEATDPRSARSTGR